MDSFDIIIAGAGPAGLSVASQLSKTNKILLIDKNKIPFTTATWYSYEERIKKLSMEKAVVRKCSSLYYEASEYSHTMKDKCLIIDEKKILNIWLEKIKKNKGTVKQLKLQSYSKSKNELIVLAGNKKFKTKLLIDCTGIHSPILKKHSLVSHFNSWICYGYSIENIKLTNLKQIKFLPVNDKYNTYIGFYPHSKTKADFYVFRNLEGKLGRYHELKKAFETSIEKYFPQAKKTSPIKGRIISGELKEYALDNIVFFGEAAMLTPPACGMGFNEILLQHKKFASGINKLLKENKLSKKSLSKLSLSLRNSETINFQRIMSKFTYYFINSPGRWEGGVKWLNALGSLSKYWMRNEITLPWIKKAVIKLNNTIPLVETAKYMPAKDFIFVTNQFMRFIQKSMVSESLYLLKEKPHIKILRQKIQKLSKESLKKIPKNIKEILKI